MHGRDANLGDHLCHLGGYLGYLPSSRSSECGSRKSYTCTGGGCDTRACEERRAVITAGASFILNSLEVASTYPHAQKASQNALFAMQMQSGFDVSHGPSWLHACMWGSRKSAESPCVK